MPRSSPSEHAFRATANALDALPEGEEKVFLARLVLILAEEQADTRKFDECIRRASAGSSTAATSATGSAAASAATPASNRTAPAGTP